MNGEAAPSVTGQTDGQLTGVAKSAIEFGLSSGIALAASILINGANGSIDKKLCVEAIEAVFSRLNREMPNLVHALMAEAGLAKWQEPERQELQSLDAEKATVQ